MEGTSRVKLLPESKIPTDKPTSNSSSENDQRRRTERRQSSPKHDAALNAPAKKKEDFRGGSCGPFLRSYLRSQCPKNQVPGSDARRSAPRRDGIKTDAAREHGEKGEGGPRSGSLSPREAVFVRETRASRLRAASRTPPFDACTASPKPPKDRTLILGSPTSASASSTRKDIDKSHSRKSHLNRSHTSEGVYDDIYLPGGSNIRRRRAKNFSLESSPSKTTDRSTLPRPTMGNTNGTDRDLSSPMEQLASSRTSLAACRKPAAPPDRIGQRKRLDDSKPSRPPFRRSPPDHRPPKHIDIATRAEILAASTLKMINRLDEINSKARRTEGAIRKNSVISENTGIRTDSKVPQSDDASRKAKMSKQDTKPILKNKPVASACGWDFQKPVSILKRKSLSQDDSQSSPPPVTFSPSVLNREGDMKRQGILKKRRSLDENEVLRRRSCSPDTSYDFKSILKTQRRSSMEELTRRSHSPDSGPQSILKRKPSKEEDAEEEPQGILKRKSLPCLNSNQNIKIFDGAATGLGDTGENVRPILKKKSSSEEYSASETLLSEVPKSILKKKTTVEAEEPEEKPKKPILKSSRVPSLEEPEEGKRGKTLVLNAFEEPKPILKRENSRSGEEENVEGVVLRRVRDNRHDRPRSTSNIDSELSAIFLKRRSLEFQPVSAISFGGELQRNKKASSNERLKGGAFLSVAEKINNLENFLEVERLERERRNSPPGTPPRSVGGTEERRRGENELEREGQELEKMTAQLATLLSPKYDGERASPDGRTDEETSSSVTVSPRRVCSLKSLDSNDIESATESHASLKSARTDLRLNDSPESEEKHVADCYFSLDKVSDLSLKEPSDPGEMDSEDLFMLRKSGSVSAKASLFKEIEKKCKADAEEDKVKKVQTGNVGINRRREKKLLESNVQRYHTQPVSTEEVEMAVRQSRSSTGDGRENEGENHEDELCTMSYKDRLRLFEATLAPKIPDARKKAVRHRTQPVTTDEVETAKSHKASAAAASSCHADDSSSGLISVCSLKTEEKSKPKGILKNFNLGNESRKSSSDSDSSESNLNLKKTLRKGEREVTSELKGILKQASLEKKEQKTSSSEEESLREETATMRGSVQKANLAALLQRVEPLGKCSQGEQEKEKRDVKPSPKYMQNAGLARIINRTRNSSLIVKSQSHSAVSSAFQPLTKCQPTSSPSVDQRNGSVLPRDEPDDGSLRAGLRRSTTQPLAPSDETADDMSGASIQERLARLRRSGELDWQKRKSHVISLEDELSVVTAGNYLLNEHSSLRDKHGPSLAPSPKQTEEQKITSSILADRLGKLDAAKEGWKKRVQPSDAVRFSVEGKMLEKKDNPSIFLSSPNRTPLPERKKRSPKATRFRSKDSDPSLRSTPSSPSAEDVGNPISRSVSAPGGGKDGLFGVSECSGEMAQTDGPVVTVPKNDDETFTSFFEGLRTSERLLQERLEIKDEDLDAVSRMKSSQLLVQKRNIKTQKRRATVKNPVKALAARLNLQEYTETKTAMSEKDLKRMKIERATRNTSLAIEALAGLASQEDFTAVSLKKASEGGISTPDAPFKSLMLLQVKGRRHVQTRLVEPVASSVNAGDCFILITPNRLFHFVGEFANVIERSRSAEICLHVQQTGDLGCSARSVVTIGEGGRATGAQVEEFWGLLGGEAGCEMEAGNVDEDELFESALVDTNMLYEVVHDELVPVEAYWGSIPKIEVLDPNKILVFDFGSELYVWNGKNVNLQKRKAALKVAKELWEEGFNYSECDLCPLTASSCHWDDISFSQKAGRVRPSWALFAKITQNMETVLFREKFLDWPDYTRVIKRRTKNGQEQESNGAPDISPCDARAMLDNVLPEVDLVLEGSHLGRGVSYFDEETRRCSEIATKGVTVWHVKEFEYSEVPSVSVGQFHMEDSYVVRWHYVITITGRELSGQPSKHLTTGRNRYAYFFWQGSDSPINDKGAAACITVELDKEHGPQVRVVQWLEPPAFLNLFSGGMVVHRGRRCSEQRDGSRLFLCRGELESETALYEMPCSMRQLRSVASFLLVSKNTGHVIVWHGCKAPDNTKKIAVQAAQRLRLETPEFDFVAPEIIVREEVEGSESPEFIRALGGENRQLYHSLLQEHHLQVRTPRLFHLTSVSGEFVFGEVGSPHLRKEYTTPLPFLQSDLYAASQPAIFLLDSSSGLWLWQGWWEESSEGGQVRFQAERKAAMTTALAYWGLQCGGISPKAYLVWAGLEPLAFTSQFPFWKDRDDVAEINMRDGRKPGEVIPIKTELARLTKSTYPLAELLNRPLPEGVVPTSLEDYLEPQCFPDVFGMEKEDFFNLPSWKKKKLKQDVGLF